MSLLLLLSHPWTPGELFVGGEKGSWYDASDLSTLWQDTAGTSAVTASGQSVARIDDKSANANNLTQATSGSRPTYTEASGLRYLDADGSADYLAGTLSASQTQPTTMFAAFKYDATTGSPSIVDLGNSNAVRQQFGVRSGNFEIYSGSALLNGPAADTSVHIAILEFNGASSSVQFDSGTASTGSPGTGTPASGDYVALFTAAQIQGTELADGRFYAGGYVNRLLTAGEKTELRAWLNAKLGLTVTAVSAAAAVALAPVGTLSGTGALSGASSLALSPVGAVLGKGVLAGAAALSLAPTGALAGRGAVSGATTLSFAPVGALAGRGALSGASAVSFAPAGSVTGTGALTGASALVFAPSGAVAGTGALGGATALALSLAGTVAGLGTLAGSSSLQFDATGMLDGGGVTEPISGSLTVSFQAAGNVVGMAGISGSAGFVLSLAGTLSSIALPAEPIFTGTRDGERQASNDYGFNHQKSRSHSARYRR